MCVWIKAFVSASCLFLLTGCATQRTAYLSEASAAGTLSDETVERLASARLGVDVGTVVTDNEDAFELKLAMIEQAQESIDLAYYIFSDDYSSSVLSRALIDAAQRGVRVRVLLDYHSSYADLDRWSMMAAHGESGGSLEVRFYNRPTRNIVKDAVYVTMGCGEVTPEGQTAGCAEGKFAEIESRFAQERIGDVAAADLNVSNLNVHNSGLLLSGLYAKDANLVALAISQGQNIDPSKMEASAGEASAESVAQLKRLGQLYWQARFGRGFERVAGRVQLGLASLLFGEQINPVFDTFTAYLPAERETDPGAARRDWRFLTEFLHHKFLLVDRDVLMLGGRNVEDSYHMQPNDLTSKYVFMDTDVQLKLSGGGDELAGAFDALWDFRAMVARLDEVRQHAPNGFLVATKTASAECAGVRDEPDNAHASCLERALEKLLARSLDERMQEHHAALQANAATYDEYAQNRRAGTRAPRFEIDAGARVYYIENLPWLTADDGTRSRGYGSVNDLEGEYGKRIHGLWLAALRSTCRQASAESPRTVLLHNAYFFLPSNLMRQFAQMVDGSLDCRHVRLKVLTNSIETTDLNVVNLAARQALKAFAEYYSDNRDPQTAAQIEFHEYRPPGETAPGAAQLSLHSKVMVIGDDVFIGSANADVRSYMLDSNNGLFIRGAPGLVADYLGWVDAIIADPARVSDVTDDLRQTSRAAMLEQDLATLRRELRKYRAERWIEDDAQMQQLETNFLGLLEEIYGLSSRLLSGGRAGKRAEARFDDEFKAI